MPPVNPGTPAALGPAALAAIRKAISEPRLGPYLLPAGGDIGRALVLYEWNCAMSSNVLRLVEAVEVAVRNGFNDALVAKYGDAWWRPDRPPAVLRGRSLESAERATRKWERDDDVLTTGKFVSEMTFGFWFSLTPARTRTSGVLLCIPPLRTRPRPCAGFATSWDA